MKKFYSFILAVIIAVAANAQETFVIDTLQAKYEAGEIVDATASVKLYIGETSETAVEKSMKDKYGFGGYLKGKANPKDAADKGYKPETMNLPTKGAYFILTPSKSGSLTVGIVANADKDVYVTDAAGNDMSSQVKYYDEKNDTEVAPEGYRFKEKLYGTATWNVEAGTSYYLFLTGSKIGFYGFQFTEPKDEASINAISTSATSTLYDLQGRKLNATPSKGMYIQNGKKYLAK